eukprot:TRINITY_DN80362_c0_g1_i1.p1 TRINITY_DN80362_c0_g1~~TRINITY_DN80362_c0_g1_i1.p1  ORF type:complete len:247 (-),score=50.64 TRINITY_DN80362_c0_g1_i1:120-860(-)
MAMTQVVRCGDVEVTVHCEEVYGKVLWPAARPLADWLADLAAQSAAAIEGPVLEIGCGAALLGLAYAKAAQASPDAWKLDGYTCVVTDFDEIVRDLAKRNADTSGVGEFICARHLDVTDTCKEDAQKLIDEFGKFPLVVASDVTYSAGVISRVVEAANMLVADGGRIMISLSVSFEEFVQTIQVRGEEHGLTVEQTVVTSAKSYIVVFSRGQPGWRLPPFTERGASAESSKAAGGTGGDRADLLFA